ncbi:hypothetical protein [Streptomyces sp. AV19]|nr:hypothetical protein [Streptomyces sp. AV19]MDG4531920.1 hypothetical protein [Streptomyces sp. AV19]
MKSQEAVTRRPGSYSRSMSRPLLAAPPPEGRKVPEQWTVSSPP